MIDRQILEDALARLVERVVLYVPNLLFAFLLLVAGWLVGRSLSALTRRAGVRLGFDALVERSGLAARLEEAGLVTSLTAVVARMVFWVVFLFSATLAVQRLGIDLSNLPVARLFSYLPNLFGALLLLVLGALVAQLAGRATQAACAGLGVDFHRGLGQGVRGLLIVFTIVLAIDQLGFDVALLTGTLVNLLTILAAGFILTFALGGKGVARNALAGFYAREHVRAGQKIKVAGIEGTLEQIGTLNAEISTPQGRVLVPNCKLVETTVEVIENEAE